MPDDDATIHDDVLPLVQVAIAARIARDHMGAVLALNRLFQLDEVRIYAAFGALTGAAALAVPKGSVPGETWAPELIAGNPPSALDPRTDRAAGFVLAYLATYIRQDPDAAVAAWRAFAYLPDGSPEAEKVAGRRCVSLAFVLMLQLAARGTQGVLDGRHGPGNRHPAVRRAAGRRAHRRDQRRR